MQERAVSYTIFETAAGACAIVWNDAGIAGFQLPGAGARGTEMRITRLWPNAARGEPGGEIARAIAATRSYFDGVRVDFSSCRLDLAGQDGLFGQIYEAVRRIPWGRATTYGALAKELGLEPQFARDVGQAMAQNPIPLIIPCHRVLAAGGSIGGFSAPGGAAAKARMLALEGVDLEPEAPAQGRLAL